VQIGGSLYVGNWWYVCMYIHMHDDDHGEDRRAIGGDGGGWTRTHLRQFQPTTAPHTSDNSNRLEMQRLCVSTAGAPLFLASKVVTM
jgi:hypothetical protein